MLNEKHGSDVPRNRLRNNMHNYKAYAKNVYYYRQSSAKIAYEKCGMQRGRYRRGM